jgi:hypothetical protein
MQGHKQAIYQNFTKNHLIELGRIHQIRRENQSLSIKGPEIHFGKQLLNIS